jgi:hypothetical protein
VCVGRVSADKRGNGRVCVGRVSADNRGNGRVCVGHVNADKEGNGRVCVVVCAECRQGADDVRASRQQQRVRRSW